MKVIAGLGNPGAEYANTPHSIGFEVVDAVARGIGASWTGSSSFKGELATALLGGVKVLLVKPQTYMNLSGECVSPVLKYHNATIGSRFNRCCRTIEIVSYVISRDSANFLCNNC